MKVRIQVNEGQISVDEMVQGADEEEIVREVRRQVEARAPFGVKLVLRTMDDRALWRRVVEGYNQRHGASEPAPTTAGEFLRFAERVGYATRLEE